MNVLELFRLDKFLFTDFQRACKLKEGLSFGWSDTLKLQSQKVRIYYTLFLTWECHFLGEPVIFLSSTLIWGWCAVRLFAQKIWIENSENAHLWCCSWDSLCVSVLWGWGLYTQALPSATVPDPASLVGRSHLYSQSLVVETMGGSLWLVVDSRCQY